jgi:hypothetical protein
MPKPDDPGEIVIRDLFPMLSEEQLEAKRAFLFGYFEIALQIFERLENEEQSGH